MTTLRDILNDLIIDVTNKATVDEDLCILIDGDNQEELLDEYIERIKRQLIGE